MLKKIFLKLISYQTTIDCNQFDIEILKNVGFFWYCKQKRNETKFFLRGGKKRNVRSQNKRNVDIPILDSSVLTQH